jgi:hypothetical protein
VSRKKQDKTGLVLSNAFHSIEYQPSGAYLVRFYQKGFPISIIIDDRLPVYQRNVRDAVCCALCCSRFCL